MNNKNDIRAEVLEGVPLRHAPTNELGVVFLFAHLARHWRLRIENINANFPDCIAYQKVKGGEKLLRIEFEYKSKNFYIHKHDPNKCDWIVCWEHDWPDAPKNLHIVELRKEFGLGFNVWIVPLRSPYKEKLSTNDSWNWSVPSQAHKGDILLFYFTRPEKCISEIFILIERAAKIEAEWKKGKDYMSQIQRICRLNAPIFFEDLKYHRIISTSHFVRRQMQGRQNATEYWPYLYDIIIRRNPSQKAKLHKFAPEKLPI